MIILDWLTAWWRRRRDYREARARYVAFVADPCGQTRSPWIKSLIESPTFSEHSRPPGSPRSLSLSSPAKARGRDYVEDMLALERIIRWRGYDFAWRGIFAALGDDLLEVVYAEEYDFLYMELCRTCPDARLRPRRRGATAAAVLGLAQGMIRGGRRSLGQGGQGPESRR